MKEKDIIIGLGFF